MGVKRALRHELVQRTPLLPNEVEKLKTGRRRYSRKTKPSMVVTLTFSAPLIIDDIIDRWSAETNSSRSSVIRAAILMADAHWSTR